MGTEHSSTYNDPPEAPLFNTFDIEGVAAYIKERQPKNIIVMMGAGVSVAAGIPDFRTPKVGLYSVLAEKYPELADNPQKVFHIDAFHKDPDLFYKVMNEMKLWPDTHPPTEVHEFVKSLETKGILRRCYTQNIDALERTVGISPDLLVEAHGSFATAKCLGCNEPTPIEHVMAEAQHGAVKCPLCKEGLVKPNVIFFGEALPPRFSELLKLDAPECDFLLIIGTSLSVYPFAAIPDFVRAAVPRVLVNMTEAGEMLYFNKKIRDVFLPGDCQVTVKILQSLAFGEAKAIAGADKLQIPEAEVSEQKKAKLDEADL
eukprot:GILI01016668.1.p1 GENE.GILI01016668.1~~GILI01016668.1.p1  ORF type:complete len:333 (+),score=57.17 GILI01016668.1:54-1001(+)